jgi:hypothetical protein
MGAHPEFGFGFKRGVLLSEKLRNRGWGAPGIILNGIIK